MHDMPEEFYDVEFFSPEEALDFIDRLVQARPKYLDKDPHDRYCDENAIEDLRKIIRNLAIQNKFGRLECY